MVGNSLDLKGAAVSHFKPNHDGIGSTLGATNKGAKIRKS